MFQALIGPIANLAGSWMESKVEQTKANVRRGLTPDQDARLNGTMINPQGSGVNIQDTNALLENKKKLMALKADGVKEAQYNKSAKDLTKAYGAGLGGTNWTEEGGYTFPDKAAGNDSSVANFNVRVQSYLRADPDGPSAAEGKLLTLFHKANTPKGQAALTRALDPTGKNGFVAKRFTHLTTALESLDDVDVIDPIIDAEGGAAKPKIIAPSSYTPAHLKEAKKNSGEAGSPEKRKYFDIRTAMLKKLIKQHPDKSKKELRAILDAMEK